jgi:hypothetical protein
MEMVRMGKYEVWLKKIDDFEKWIRAKNDITKFYALSEKEKETIFLQWKHGLSNADSNSALDDNLKQFSHMVSRLTDEDWESLDEGTREYYQQKIKWSDYCDGVWRGILGRTATLRRDPSGRP